MRRRGHRVTVFQIPSLKPRVEREGLEFCALGSESDELAAAVDRLGRSEGLASLRLAVQGAVQLAGTICNYGPEAIRKQGIDLLLVDQNEPAGGTVAEHLGLPFVSVCPSLPLNREPAIPPPFVTWRYSPSWWARLRNRAGYAASDRLIAPIQKVLNHYRARWGLQVLGSPDDSFSRLAQLCQMPSEFDFPREQLPANFHYLGPFTGTTMAEMPFPFERLDGRPLVFASMGTLQSGARDYFRKFAESCVGLGVQLVMATGGSATESNLPGEPIMVNWAPQLAILERASLAITHAGLNTVMQSLKCGVPMVAIPMTHDQPAIAARLARTGAGVVLTPKEASAKRIRQAVTRVLKDTRHREAAQTLRRAIIDAGGVERGADIVDRILREIHAPRNH